ncbi:MAG: flagellin, partial [Lachnospiraceae bacterium]
TDMAEEMTEYTKQQVLSQAATSVLAQANDIPQQVLQLLQ